MYLASGIAIALMFANDQANNWSTLYMKHSLLASSATAALSLATYQGAALLTRLTGDWWVRRFGPRAVVRTAAAIGVIGLIIVVSAPGPIPALAGFLIIGLGVPGGAAVLQRGRPPHRGTRPGRGRRPAQPVQLRRGAGRRRGGGAVWTPRRTGSDSCCHAIRPSLILLARYFHPKSAVVDFPA